MGKSLVSNNIRTLRFHHVEMTQKELAERAGVVSGVAGIVPYSPPLSTHDVTLEAV